MNEDDTTAPAAELIAEPPIGRAKIDVSHLQANRGLIIRRSLLATAVGAVVPVPVVDEYVSGRIRAGMLMKVAQRREVDVALSSAELLADPREGSTLRNATLTAATLVALKLAWRKFFALLAVGRSAEEMATSFQVGTLFDHYCAKMHLGAGLDREAAVRLHRTIHAALGATEKGTLVSAFREGAAVLNRSISEAPAWVAARFEKAAGRWVETGGRSTDSTEEVADGLDAAADGSPADAVAERWVDRAAAVVERKLGAVGQNYLSALISGFEERWRTDGAAPAASTAGEPSSSASS